MLAVAVPAIAFRARPVSDLRFENRLLILRPAAAASDGSDYLVLLNTPSQTYIQIVSQGANYGPPVYIGEGTGVAALWTGSHYVVAWTTNDPGDYNGGVFLTPVSRRGVVISEPKLIIARPNFAVVNAVWNGQRILVTSVRSRGLIPGADLVGALANSNGWPIGEEHPIVDSSGAYAIVGTNDGFAVAMFGNTETRVYRLDGDAKPLLAGGALADAWTEPAHFASEGSLASDGTNVAAIYTSPDDGATKSVIIGPRGEIVQGPRSIAGPRGQVRGALWNGTEYVFEESFLSSVTQRQAVLQRISRAGEPLDVPIALATTSVYSDIDQYIITSSGREYLATSGASFIRLAIGSTTPTAPVELTNRLMDEQGALSFARGGQGFLAVWSEWDRNFITVRASRLDAEGRYLDGAGIVLDTLPITANTAYLPSTSVDSNGGSWLAVWAHDGYIYGRRISPDGVLLDPKPITISPGDSPVVRWGINSWLVVIVHSNSTIGTVSSATVTSDGIAGPLIVADEVGSQLPGSRSSLSSGANPALAFDGQSFVLAWPLGETSGGYPFYDGYTSIVIERLGLSGELVPGSRFILPPEKYRSNVLSLATNGTQDLVVFEDGAHRLQGLLLNQGSFYATMPLGPWYELQGETAATWNGNEFVVAHNTDYGVRLIHTSKFGVEGATDFLQNDSGELQGALVFPPSSPVRQRYPPETDPLGLLSQHATYDGVPRAGFLSASDIAALNSTYTPATPVILNADGDGEGATVTWKPQDHVLGFMIELRQSDGTDRLVGVAAGSASSLHVSYSGLTGTTLHLRAWNAYYISSPSLQVKPTSIPRSRAVR
ncbi:MAG TPA: hypothetical protein VHX14_01415 [Thermoanaerobaculia bacterium]|nr:hypothetical protein [Thermoanaerobaculia bacterium]